MAIPNLILSLRLAAFVSLITCTDCAGRRACVILISKRAYRVLLLILIAAGLTFRPRFWGDDDHLNAFVIDRRHIFLHSGLILRSKTPEMLQSVIAHEAAHMQMAISHDAVSPTTAEMPPISARPPVAVGAASGSGQAATGIALGVRAVQHVNSCHTAAPKKALQINLPLAIWCVRGSIRWDGRYIKHVCWAGKFGCWATGPPVRSIP